MKAFKEFLEEKQSFKIYLDLDGVLVDFIKGVEKLGFSLEELKNESNGVKDAIANAKGFWENLEWTQDGKDLFEFLKNYDVEILSASPKKSSETAKKEKINWCIRELNIKKNRINIVERSEKKNFANINSLLIDDYDKNVKEFIANGGKGILHKNTKETINQISNTVRNFFNENDLKRIKQFRSFKDGWDNGVGKELSSDSIKTFNLFFEQIDLNFDPSVFFTRNGNLSLVWETPKNSIIELEFFTNKIEYFIEETNEESEFSLNDMQHLIKKLKLRKH